MTIQLPPSMMRNTAQYDCQHYLVQLPPDISYSDIFAPVFWAHHPRLNKFDTIRVIAHDWSWDVTVTVVAKTKGGANVQLTPVLPESPGEISTQVVPLLRNGKMAIRVEWTKAVKWRVIALDQSEHSHGYETRGEAEAAMAQYIAELGMVMPPDEPEDDVPAEAPSVEAKAPKGRAKTDKAA